MKIIWLGQAGLLFETDKTKILIDPYLSNSVAAVNPANFRRVAANEEFLKIKPDIIIFTHNHLDHYDPETVKFFISTDTDITVLAPYSVWSEVRKIGGQNNYVMFNRHTVWSEKGMLFTAVKAEHSDPYAIGVIIEAEGKKYYITGDTLYNDEIFSDIPNGIDTVFLPVNGVGNNMNFTDAARFAERVGAEHIVPIHFGMFDGLDVKSEFICKNKIIPEIYKEVVL